MICDEVTDAQDVRTPTMQECGPEAVFSAAGSFLDPEIQVKQQH